MAHMVITDLLVLHGLRDEGLNPAHTPEGIKQIVSLGPAIKEFDPSMVAMGEAKRFVQMYDAFYRGGFISDWHTIMISYLLGYIGTRSSIMVAGSDGKKIHTSLVVSMLGFLTPRSHLGLVNMERDEYDAWNVVRKRFPLGTIFLCNSQFSELLIKQSKTPDAKTASASILGINRYEERVMFLIKGIVGQPDAVFTKRMARTRRVLQLSAKLRGQYQEGATATAS